AEGSVLTHLQAIVTQRLEIVVARSVHAPDEGIPGRRQPELLAIVAIGRRTDGRLTGRTRGVGDLSGVHDAAAHTAHRPARHRAGHPGRDADGAASRTAIA